VYACFHVLYIAGLPVIPPISCSPPQGQLVTVPVLYGSNRLGTDGLYLAAVYLNLARNVPSTSHVTVQPPPPPVPFYCVFGMSHT
jgi:hypothetical protein